MKNVTEFECQKTECAGRSKHLSLSRWPRTPETIPRSDCWRSDCPPESLWRDWWSQCLDRSTKSCWLPLSRRDKSHEINMCGCMRPPPAAKPSKILFFRSTGWLLVLISTPACAFLKMSFSSSKPKDRQWCLKSEGKTLATRHPGFFRSWPSIYLGLH